ncbi:MAG: PAS domain-containing sensor histidine kinase [Syntrophobacteraceae bacterium]
MQRDIRRRAAVILILGMIITTLLYSTQADREARFFYHLDVTFLGLYFIPIILAGLWFGLVVGVLASTAVALVLVPYLVWHWEGLSASDLTRFLQITEYIIVAVVLGKVVENQRREEARSKQSESLAAVGKSIAAVAHDMKTSLVAIGGFSNLIKRHLAEDFLHRDKIDIVIEETRHLERMIMDLLAFSKPMELNRSECDAGRIVSETLSASEELARRRMVVLKKEAPGHSMLAMLDAMRIKQALTNLVTNAIEASPAGEKVTVRCYHKSRSVVFEVVDCGCGIPVEQRPEIFFPFFTTKKEGTGFGLSNAEKIVEAHGGYLEVLDNPQKGLTFRAVIPNTPR